jgi:hypothetical protein
MLFGHAADQVRAQALNPAFAGAGALGSAIVDLMTLGPGPSDTNPFVVLNRCAKNGCKSILRKCYPLDLTAARDAFDRDGMMTSGTVLDAIFDQLHGQSQLVTEDAPDDELLVRLVTTTLTCEQIAQLPTRISEWPLDAAQAPYGNGIFGCGYAGPLHLDSVHGQLFIGLPTLDTVTCVPQVAICAADLDFTGASALADSWRLNL